MMSSSSSSRKQQQRAEAQELLYLEMKQRLPSSSSSPYLQEAMSLPRLVRHFSFPVQLAFSHGIASPASSSVFAFVVVQQQLPLLMEIDCSMCANGDPVVKSRFSISSPFSSPSPITAMAYMIDGSKIVTVSMGALCIWSCISNYHREEEHSKRLLCQRSLIIDPLSVDCAPGDLIAVSFIDALVEIYDAAAVPSLASTSSIPTLPLIGRFYLGSTAASSAQSIKFSPLLLGRCSSGSGSSSGSNIPDHRSSLLLCCTCASEGCMVVDLRPLLVRHTSTSSSTTTTLVADRAAPVLLRKFQIGSICSAAQITWDNHQQPGNMILAAAGGFKAWSLKSDFSIRLFSLDPDDDDDGTSQKQPLPCSNDARELWWGTEINKAAQHTTKLSSSPPPAVGVEKVAWRQASWNNRNDNNRDTPHKTMSSWSQNCNGALGSVSSPLPPDQQQQQQQHSPHEKQPAHLLIPPRPRSAISTFFSPADPRVVRLHNLDAIITTIKREHFDSHNNGAVNINNRDLLMGNDYTASLLKDYQATKMELNSEMKDLEQAQQFPSLAQLKLPAQGDPALATPISSVDFINSNPFDKNHQYLLSCQSNTIALWSTLSPSHPVFVQRIAGSHAIVSRCVFPLEREDGSRVARVVCFDLQNRDAPLEVFLIELPSLDSPPLLVSAPSLPSPTTVATAPTVTSSPHVKPGSLRHPLLGEPQSLSAAGVIGDSTQNSSTNNILLDAPSVSAIVESPTSASIASLSARTVVANAEASKNTNNGKNNNNVSIPIVGPREDNHESLPHENAVAVLTAENEKQQKLIVELAMENRQQRDEIATLKRELETLKERTKLTGVSVSHTA